MADFVESMKFNPISYSHTPSDLNTLSEDMKILSTWDIEGKLATNALEQAIANAPLDKSEEAYREALLGYIWSYIDKMNTPFGYVNAKEEVDRLMKNIFNSREFQEKTNNNVLHKAFVDKVEKDDKLSNVEKWWYKWRNPYYHDGNKFEETGEMDVWEPLEDVIHMPDMDNLFIRAMKEVSPVEVGGTYVNYDANGNRIDIYTQDVNGRMLRMVDNEGKLVQGYGVFTRSADGKYEYLPPDRIKAAIKNVIMNDTQLLEAFSRQLDIYRDATGTYEDDKGEVHYNHRTGEDIVRYYPHINDSWFSVDNFIDYKIDGFAATKSYFGGLQGRLRESPPPRGNSSTSGKSSKEAEKAAKEAKKAEAAANKRFTTTGIPQTSSTTTKPNNKYTTQKAKSSTSKGQTLRQNKKVNYPTSSGD